jgi:uncharacterized protein YcsI (UPF0317 family)
MPAVENPVAAPRAAATETGREARLRIRRGEHRGHTARLAPGHVQGNLVILPRAFAADFGDYCRRNPQACPLLAEGAPGDPRLPALGADLDIRTDVPAYRVWRDGALAAEVEGIVDFWRDDLVSFVLGGSFTLEHAMLAEGLKLKSVEMGIEGAAFRTTLETIPVGPFRGTVAVSMRAFTPADAIRAITVTARYPSAHGAPLHIGLPEQIGIRDLAKPDYGFAVPVPAGELPLFWACGLTTHEAVQAARPPLCITHLSAHMLVTDLRLEDIAAY